VLQARIQEKERSERAAKEAALRKGLIGSGDRSDRIRTYNFPQGRLTDHRINLTLYKLGQVMDGDPPATIAQALANAQTGGLARLDAQMLLLLALDRPRHDRAWLLTRDTDPLDGATARRFTTLVQRRRPANRWPT
jgi:hypothetical protein